MVNFNETNLVEVDKSTISANTLAIKVNDMVLIMGGSGGGGGDIDLSFITAAAGDIRSGKVGADAEGNPVNGTFKAVEFYKCTSVDTATQTWSGRKAVMSDGAYSFEESITTGLTYTEVIPENGMVYTSDALAEIKNLLGATVPTEGLVFYAPLDAAASSAVTGQELEVSGTVTYETVDGIKCAYFDESARIYSYNTAGLPSKNTPRTLSIWVRPGTTSQDGIAFGYGKRSTNAYFGVNLSDGIFTLATASNSNPVQPTFSANLWCHYACTYDGVQLKVYINGSLYGEDPFPTPVLATSLSYIDIGGSDDGLFYQGYSASARIYDRALSGNEIKALSKEFNV